MALFENVVTPESVGVSSANVEKFINALTSNELCTHGFMLIKDGKCFAKAYEPHFSDTRTHRMYSVSKTFVSAAIGVLAGEGKISLDDKVISYFPDKLPEKVHPYIAEATIRDLLIMATPFTETTYRPDADGWTASFFNTVPSHKPGTIFHYDTSGTYILDVIVERVTGKPFLEYLHEKVFKHIGFTEVRKCVKAPDGNSWGGSGVLCTLPELAAFAQLFMNGGKNADGVQLIPADYVKAATTKQISNECDNHFSKYYNHGYGYQIWITEGGYSFLGMGNQLAVSFPEKGIILAIYSDDQGNGSSRDVIYNSVIEYIVEPAQDKPLEENGADFEKLIKACGTLTFPLPHGTAHSESEKLYGSKTYKMEENRMGITELRFDFEGDGGVMTYMTTRGLKKLTFGLGRYDDGVFPETHYSGDTIGTPLGRGYECHTAAVWDSEDKLILRSYLTDDYFGNMTLSFGFKGKSINLFASKTAEWFLDEYRGFACGEIK